MSAPIGDYTIRLNFDPEASEAWDAKVDGPDGLTLLHLAGDDLLELLTEAMSVMPEPVARPTPGQLPPGVRAYGLPGGPTFEEGILALLDS